MILNRNEKCWCGSNKAYRDCHYDLENKLKAYKKIGCIVPFRSLLLNEQQIEGIKRSGKINTAILDEVANQIRVGMSTEDINDVVHKFTLAHGAVPAPLNYNGFPKSVCTSINEEVCHGIPDQKRFLKAGDIVNVDVSTIYQGYYSDASRMFIIGQTTPEKQRLVQIAKECLEKGLEAVKPWGFVGDIAQAVQSHAESNGYSVVRELGGHGVGLKFHEDPFISHVGKKGTGMMMVPGMSFTIEPMINMGKHDVYIDRDNEWTIYTKDNLPSAQWEHQVLVTETGYEIISE